MITITDEIAAHEPVSVYREDEITEAIRPWFPEAPTEVYQTLDLLHTDLCRGDYTGDLETYLGIRIHRAGAA